MKIEKMISMKIISHMLGCSLAKTCRVSKMLPLHCPYFYYPKKCYSTLLLQSRILFKLTNKCGLLIHTSPLCPNSDSDSKVHTTGPNEMSEVLNNLLVQWKENSGSEVVRYNEEQLTGIIGLLLNAKIFASDISEGLGKFPHLVTKSQMAWEKAVMDLKKYYQPRRILPLIVSCPSLLEGKTKTMLQTIETLRRLQFIEGEIQQVTVENPAVLVMNPSDLCKRYANLQTIFPSESCRKIIRKFPSLLTEEWRTIQEKVDYALVDMGLEEVRLVRTNFFSLSLSEIKSRHLFLSRAGLYQRPNKLGETKTPNPLAKMIFNTGAKEFAGSVAHMPLHEYLAFRKIVKLEEEVMFEMSESDGSDFDDSDSDSSDSESETDG